MRCQELGVALWQPEPNPAHGVVQLGDIGYVLEGRFIRFFNIFHSGEDPMNHRGVPPGFEHLVIDRNELVMSDPQALDPSKPLLSESVTHRNISAEISATM